MVVNNNKEIMKIADNYFNEFINNPESSKLSPDLRFLLYSTALKNETESENNYYKLYNFFKSTQLNEEQVRILSSFGNSNNMKIIENALNLSLSNEVRSQDIVSIIARCAMNPIV